MILKDYQAAALRNLEDFLKILDSGGTISESFKKFWLSRDLSRPEEYQSNISGVPQVCFKVPTGGGKTFMAAASLKVIFDAMPAIQKKMVVWLVPSETILTQTYKNLQNAAHPYHQRLIEDFGGQIAIYNKEQLLSGENFSPAEVSEQISVLVLSYDSFRTSNKEGRKVYQENGQLLSFSGELGGENEISLANVIKNYNPVVIIDESHHATTNLSLEMLKNFNPSFILELTATPKPKSNVIAYVPAAKLKNSGMVKLPVIVYNRQSRENVIYDALNFRNFLESVGRAEKIRPIVLFQAETQGKGDRATFDKIKLDLIENHGISAEEIAIKTAEVNDLKNIDLMAENCRIRYIITVNALKEGWDCPFAYILASLANRNSEIDVEQILGRILRRPFTKNFTEEFLNMSYVFTSSANFKQTLDKIVIGLNSAGFSDRDYKIAIENENSPQNPIEQQNFQSEAEFSVENMQKTAHQSNEGYKIVVGLNSAGFSDRNYKIATENGIFPANSPQNPIEQQNLPSEEKFSRFSVENMRKQAHQASESYKIENIGVGEIISVEEREKMTEFPMREEFREDASKILLPQLFIAEKSGNLFGNEDILVSQDILCKNFSLSNKDAEINFDNLSYEIASIDVQSGENMPRYKNLSEIKRESFLEHFKSLPDEAKIRQCAEILAEIIDKRRNTPSTQEITAYVRRIVSKFDRDRLCDAIIHANIYADRIKDKIEALTTEYAKKIFLTQVESRKIFAKGSFKFPASISPPNFESNMAKSLYVAEESVNDFEWRIAYELTGLENVLWWHRNRSKKGFCLNGFINHYPDFIIKLKSGIILLVEAKGSHLDKNTSKNKFELGKIWESKCGTDKFGYFMVFDGEPLAGALNLEEFLSCIAEF